MFKNAKEMAKKKLSSKKDSGKEEQTQAGPSQPAQAQPGPSHQALPHPPDKRLLQDPLEWKNVREMNAADMKRHIIARSNFFTQTVPWLLRIQATPTIVSWIGNAKKAKRGGVFIAWKNLFIL